MIKILIADDHHVVRRGLRQLLEQEKDFLIVGESKNGRDVLNLLDAGLEADVLLTDLNMPVMRGLEMAKVINEKYPLVQMIFLTMHEEESYIQQAFQAGIKSYIFKTADAEELIFAVRQAARQLPYLCSGHAQKIIGRIMSPGNLTAGNIGNIEFSEREMEVLQLMAAGYTSEEVASRLFTSKRTVEGHRQSLIDKTGSPKLFGPYCICCAPWAATELLIFFLMCNLLINQYKIVSICFVRTAGPL
ncbi:response regulator transcription factor [Mucilaginibacter celer]|uniref:Response regulator n=1 Tax=Mucilaginibacter celer TaxID=2305508 RepID=A0A494VMC6_9SPHI|nr:response regulator transcription factor [Mucilaginibacter celer]AYL95269.1 response regulator [Mucilaginibacter celer]